MQEEDTDLTKNIKKKILDSSYNEKYEDDDTQKLLDLASFLDPGSRWTSSVQTRPPKLRPVWHHR